MEFRRNSLICSLFSKRLVKMQPKKLKTLKKSQKPSVLTWQHALITKEADASRYGTRQQFFRLSHGAFISRTLKHL